MVKDIYEKNQLGKVVEKTKESAIKGAAAIKVTLNKANDNIKKTLDDIDKKYQIKSKTTEVTKKTLEGTKEVTKKTLEGTKKVMKELNDKTVETVTKISKKAMENETIKSTFNKAMANPTIKTTVDYTSNALKESWINLKAAFNAEDEDEKLFVVKKEKPKQSKPSQTQTQTSLNPTTTTTNNKNNKNNNSNNVDVIEKKNEKEIENLANNNVQEGDLLNFIPSKPVQNVIEEKKVVEGDLIGFVPTSTNNQPQQPIQQPMEAMQPIQPIQPIQTQQTQQQDIIVQPVVENVQILQPTVVQQNNVVEGDLLNMQK